MRVLFLVGLMLSGASALLMAPRLASAPLARSEAPLMKEVTRIEITIENGEPLEKVK